MAIGRWIVDAATAVHHVTDGVERAETLSRRAVSGARDAARGVVGVHRVGVERRRNLHHAEGTELPANDVVAEIVGAVLGADPAGLPGGAFAAPPAPTPPRGISDREIALVLLEAGFAEFRADVEPRVDEPGAPATRAQWWSADALPVLSDWEAFRAHASSWVERAATEWSTYEDWLTVLRQLRSGARAQGLLLSSHEPGRLPETVFERGARGHGSKIEAAWTIGRVLLYTAVGGAGLLSLWALARDLRGRGEQSTSPMTTTNPGGRT